MIKVVKKLERLKNQMQKGGVYPFLMDEILK
jgi:hypothetical protein